MFNYLRSRGYHVVVGKVLMITYMLMLEEMLKERRIEYNGLRVKVFSRSSSIEAFKKMS